MLWLHFEWNGGEKGNRKDCLIATEMVSVRVMAMGEGDAFGSYIGCRIKI